MSIFKWDQSMSVGIEKFDSAHKKLVSHIDELFRAMGSGQGKVKLTETLSSLKEYAVTHFREEEDAMTEHGFVELGSHKAEHDRFISRVDEFCVEHGKHSLFLTPQVLEFMKSWLVEHIMDTDMRYSKYLQGKGMR